MMPNSSAATANTKSVWLSGRLRFAIPSPGPRPNQPPFQVDMAMEAFWNGGWFGLGPGEGVAKRNLPDRHTDLGVAVAPAEFGTILAPGLLALFALVAVP